MKVRKLIADSGRFQRLVVSRDEEAARLLEVDGRPLSAQWEPLEVEVFRDYEDVRELDRPAGDFPSLASHLPVLSARAAEALRPVLEKHGEVLPLKSPDGDFYAFNVTRVVDALDLEKSEIQHFRSSGRIKRITRHVFKPEALEGVAVFRLSQTPKAGVFVTQSFIDLVDAAGLEGVTFDVP